MIIMGQINDDDNYNQRKKEINLNERGVIVFHWQESRYNKLKFFP